MRLPSRSPVARAGVRAGLLTSYKRAEAIGCSRVYLLKIEQGTIRPSPRIVEKMAEVYKLAPQTLWNMIREARRERLKRELQAC
jgi:transcriptional regulator with XRE-family HTH domain